MTAVASALEHLDLVAILRFWIWLQPLGDTEWRIMMSLKRSISFESPLTI